MGNFLKIILGIMIFIVIIWSIIFIVDYNRCNNLKTPIFVIEGEKSDDTGSGTYYGLGYKVKIEKNISSEYGLQIECVEMYFGDRVVAGAISQIDINSLEQNTVSDIVIIRDGNIEDESIIENFINKVNNNTDKEEIVLYIKEYNTGMEVIEKELKFIPGTKINESTDKNMTVTDSPDTSEEAKKQFGYYSLTINDEIDKNETFSAYYWKLNRNIEDNIVKFCLESVGLIEVTEFPVICNYSLESSNYTNNFKLNYHQRKDMGIKTIIDKNTSNEYDYNVYTFGGDITITVDTDMVYILEEALKQRVITIDDILKQAKIDEQYGICELGFYSDGGSSEYMYNKYTILKFNTLDGKKDVVFGFSGQNMNRFNEMLKD